MDSGGSSALTLAAGVAGQPLPNRNGRRIAFTVTNVGANPAYITLSNSEIAVAGQGIYLLPGGSGNVQDSNGDTYKCWQGAISAISTLGTSLAIWERVQL